MRKRTKSNIKSSREREIIEDALVAIEQQLNSEETKYVRECFERLLTGGNSEKNAKEKIAEALLKEADLIHETGEEFSEERYKKYLDELK